MRVELTHGLSLPRQQLAGVLRGIERAADIEDDPMPFRRAELDAVAADCLVARWTVSRTSLNLLPLG
jgi:hypothetical protein